MTHPHGPLRKRGRRVGRNPTPGTPRKVGPRKFKPADIAPSSKPGAGPKKPSRTSRKSKRLTVRKSLRQAQRISLGVGKKTFVTRGGASRGRASVRTGRTGLARILRKKSASRRQTPAFGLRRRRRR